MKSLSFLSLTLLLVTTLPAQQHATPKRQIADSELEDLFTPPIPWQGKAGSYRSPLRFADGRVAQTHADWQDRRVEILNQWEQWLGKWPPLITQPEVEIIASTKRESLTQIQIRFHWTPHEKTTGYLLVPAGDRPHPAVLCVYYEPETGVGLGKPNRDFALAL